VKTARTLIIIVLLFTSLSLFAQSPNRPPLKANIPFAFSVEGHLLPAGDYLIQAGTTERAIRIVSVDGKHAAVVNTVTQHASSRSANGRLVLQKCGDEYCLTEVWGKDDDFSRSPMVSKRHTTTEQSGGGAETNIVLAYAGH